MRNMYLGIYLYFIFRYIYTPKAKKGSVYGPSSRAPAYQVCGPEFKPQYHKKKIITAENSPNLINMDIWIYKAQKFPQTHATQRGLLQDTL
jgi:hypothetical protein